MENSVNDILSSVAKVQRELEGMFRDFWSKFLKYRPVLGYGEPPADIEDKESELVVYVDLPGFSKEEIKIKVTEDMLEVKAEKSEERKLTEKSRNYIVKERMYESFYKRIHLPVKVRPEQARAKLVNGVLEIYLPKSEATREIEVRLE